MKNFSLLKLDLSRNQQNILNMVASIVTMGVTTLISFFLSPFIVKNLGAEANGFVNLANNFIVYAILLRTALNSMGSRFIMMAYYNNEKEKAQKYYSSLFIGDLVLSFVFLVTGLICVWKLEYILNIPNELVSDTKLLFGILFLNFVFNTALTMWSSVPYIVNRLYLDSIVNAQVAIVRAIIIVVLFALFSPKLYYVAIATLIAGLINYSYNLYYKVNLLPEFKVKRQYFSWAAIKELLSSGVWNSISSLGTTLTNGLDLLITNLFVSPLDMGVLSIAKTMPSFIETLNEQIAMAFSPSMIMDYSREDLNSLKSTIKQSSRIISVICSLPLGFLIVFGDKFYALWQPTQNAKTLQLLSIITIAGRIIFTGIQPLFNVFTVVNKVKQNSIVTIINGIASAVITFVLVKTTNLGVYAVAGVSVVCCAIKNLAYVVPYSAKYLGLNKSTFYSTIFDSAICTFVLCVVGYLIRMFMICNTWVNLIITAILFCGIGFVCTSFVVLKKNERKLLYNKIKGILLKK